MILPPHPSIFSRTTMSPSGKIRAGSASTPCSPIMWYVGMDGYFVIELSRWMSIFQISNTSASAMCVLLALKLDTAQLAPCFVHAVDRPDDAFVRPPLCGGARLALGTGTFG